MSESVPSSQPAGDEPAAARRPPGWTSCIWGWVVKAAAAGALVHPAARVIAPYWWPADLLTHFGDLALIATLAAVALAATHRRRLAVVLAILACWQAFALLRYSGANPVPPDPVSSDRLRIVFMNLLEGNTMYEDAIHLIEVERPDVVGLVEYTPAWHFALARLRRDYPYRIDAIAGADGLSLWFREPPLVLDPPRVLTPGGWPVLSAVFDFAGTPTRIWLIHPCSPLKPGRRVAGFPELEAIAEWVGAVPGPRIVVGDFNTSEGSPHFARFERVSGLRDTRLGFGRQPSWPTMRRYAIAIDHAFVSQELSVVDRRRGHMIGSDHFPIVLELAPSASRASICRASDGQSSAPP